ncbi:uncharacterized protein [Hyperolius riggenbachi]|uniref:uncharacterized protein n=1 Tax=Hyperolius riggenbachi TaxID=752182 RepID=UPI0035A2809B
MLKTQRRTGKQAASRCEKEEFVCQGWDVPAPQNDEDEDLNLVSCTRKCKYLERDSLVISPDVYHRASEIQCKTDSNSFSCPNILDIHPLAKAEDTPKIFSDSSGPSVIKYCTANKDFINGNENGSRVKRLIRITDAITNRQSLDRTTSYEGNINVCEDQYDDSVAKTEQGSILHSLNNRMIISEMGLRFQNDTIENYKDAIAKLRGQTVWKSFSGPSENLEKSSFHGHIQTCILQLSNRSTVQPSKLITCGGNAALLKSAASKGKTLEGQSQRFHLGQYQGSFPASQVISKSRSGKIDGEKFAWSQNTQEISRVGTCDDKTGLVRISPPSPGKENARHPQEVWGFPAFHQYPVKTQHHYSASSSIGHIRSGKRNQSASRYISSSQSHGRSISDTNKDFLSMGNQVTLGLMLGALRTTGLKQNQIRLMLGQANRFVAV